MTVHYLRTQLLLGELFRRRHQTRGDRRQLFGLVPEHNLEAVAVHDGVGSGVLVWTVTNCLLKHGEILRRDGLGEGQLLGHHFRHAHLLDTEVGVRRDDGPAGEVHTLPHHVQSEDAVLLLQNLTTGEQGLVKHGEGGKRRTCHKIEHQPGKQYLDVKRQTLKMNRKRACNDSDVTQNGTRRLETLSATRRYLSMIDRVNFWASSFGISSHIAPHTKSKPNQPSDYQ